MTRIFPILLLATLAAVSAGASEPLPLWAQTAPGEKGDLGVEHDTTKPDGGLVGGKRVIRLGDVSVPTLTVYSPRRSKDPGAAVMVCPGGGYQILSPELTVTSNTPPTFLFQAEDDRTVPVEGSLYYYLALKQAKVPAELHLFATGGHGFGLRGPDRTPTTWPKLAEAWMRAQGILQPGNPK